MSETIINYTNEQLKEYHDKMWKVVYETRKLIVDDVPITIWIACQQKDRQEWYGVMATFGKKPDYMDAFFTFEQLDTLTFDELAQSMFVQMYGFMPDSHEDRLRKYHYWLEMTEMTRLKIKVAQIDYDVYNRRCLDAKKLVDDSKQ